MITIVGGTYQEICFEPHWDEVFGSGLRACLALLEIDKSAKIHFNTFVDAENELYLSTLSNQIDRFEVTTSLIKKTPTFSYDYPLIVPRITPRPDALNNDSNRIKVKGEDVIYFGILEGHAEITGNRVVYDPQSPVNPIPFSKTGSVAQQLVVVTNLTEARAMAGSSDLKEIKRYFLEEEKAYALIVKMGPKGALVCSKEGHEELIPVYKTRNVWPIGSGDIFVAIFSHFWFQGKSVFEAAKEASWATACYCNTKSFSFTTFESNTDIQPLLIEEHISKQIYVAGPFFTFTERWLVDQVRNSLLSIGHTVFSPFHDVGIGLANDVVEKDIEGINSSDLIFAIIDGLDSGTLFEVGYAIAKKIPVIAYVQNETSDSLKMLEGTNCIILHDLTTAIYHAYWQLLAHE